MLSATARQRVADAGVEISGLAHRLVVVKVGNVTTSDMSRHPAAALCRGLAGIGLGHVCLCGAIEYFNDLAERLADSSFQQEPGMWLPETVLHQMPPSDMAIDLSNDLPAAQVWLRQAASLGVHCLAITWGSSSVNMWTGSALIEPPSKNNADSDPVGLPLSPIARVAAGLALQEAVLRAGRVHIAAPPSSVVTYDMSGTSGTAGHVPAAEQTIMLRDKVLDVIGLGGIGCHAVEALAPLLGPGSTLNLFDFDSVAPENIGLQITYTSADVGKPKAVAMADRLAGSVAEGVTIRPYSVRYEDRPRSLPQPHVRVSCPDTWAARYYVNEQCLQDGVPLVDAGSAPLAAQVRTCLPGRTACLAHQIPGLARKAAEELTGESCATNPALTLPGTNAIAGGLLAAEVCALLQPGVFGPRPQATLTYDARCPARFGQVGFRPACTHGLSEANHRIAAGNPE
jgi:molybdopterin/thiamine biosynthesis adenylyltransferase